MAQHIIENDFLRVTVDDHGAELISVYDKESDLERIWNADPAVWNRHAPILFPFVGRVNHNVYRYQGKTYELKLQHGFARDMEFECIAETEDSVTHFLKADEKTLALYPFEFALTVTHRFAPGNGRKVEVQWEICNCGQTEMFYSIGGHPGFTVPAKKGEEKEDYFLGFPGKDRLDYIRIHPESGMAVPDVIYPLWLYQGFLMINDDMFDRDALIFENGQVDTVQIARPDRSPYITMECADFPSLGVWSKRGGKFLCLEPWAGRVDDHGFEGELSEKAGEQRLPAQESRKMSYSMEFHRC